jgi:outer membrane protein assembly factor BamB
LYLGSCDGVFYSLNAVTGELNWKYDTSVDGPANEFHSEPVVNASAVVIGSDLREPDATGHIYAFQPVTGELKWKYDLKNGVAGTILSHKSHIYAMSFQDSLIGLDIETGKQVTPVEEASTSQKFIFPSSPALVNDTIIYARRSGNVRAIHANTHREIWSQNIPEQITSDLVVDNNFILLATEGKKIYRMALDTGKITASFPTAGVVRWKLLSLGAHVVFLEWNDAERPTLRCIDSAGKEIWQQPSPEGSYWDTYRPLLWKNLVIVGSAAGHVSAFDSSNGRQVWSTQVNGRVRMLGSSEDFIYAGCSNGILYALLPLS